MVSVIRPTPVKWGSVKLSEVISKGKRLEASVFDIEARNAIALVTSNKYGIRMLCGEQGFATAYTCGRFKRQWVKKSDFPIYQPSSITETYPVPDGFLSQKTKTDLDALRVRKNQILMTCSGTIGKVSLVSKTLDTLIFSHDLLRIHCKNEDDIGYIYTFLKSKIGKTIVQSNYYGAVVTHIEPEHLSKIPVPNAPIAIKKRIHALVTKSYALRDEANELLDKAHTLLASALDLPKIEDLQISLLSDSTRAQLYAVKLSQLNSRLDASYHIPLAQAVLQAIAKNAAEVTTVGDARISKDIILPGRFKRFYVEEGSGRVFIGGKQIYELDPENKKYLSLTHHGARIAQQLELHENMTLITCSGTIGKVVLVGRHWENWTASQHIIRIVPANDDIAGYLSVFLSSEYGYQLITRHTYGSVVDEIDDSHVSRVQIPLLKCKETQKEINDCALQANQKRYEAYCLEQEALKIMQDEVLYAKESE